MAVKVDKAAVREKARALVAAMAPVPVSLPGLGDVFVRPLDGGDWVARQVATQRHLAAGVELTPKFIFGLGLAQNLCDETGAHLFDLMDVDDVLLLSRLPVEDVNAALARIGEGEARDPLAEAGSEADPKA